MLALKQRVNVLISLEVSSCSWSIVPTKGEIPCPRSYHAASRYRNLMIIHGGEGKLDAMRPNTHVSFDATEQIAEMSRSMADDSTNPTILPAHSQSTSVLNAPAALEDERRVHAGHDGVTLGDSLCGTKLAGQIKVN